MKLLGVRHPGVSNAYRCLNQGTADAFPPIRNSGLSKVIFQRSRVSGGRFGADAEETHESNPIDWAIDHIAIDVTNQQQNSWSPF